MGLQKRFFPFHAFSRSGPNPIGDLLLAPATEEPLLPQPIIGLPLCAAITHAPASFARSLRVGQLSSTRPAWPFWMCRTRSGLHTRALLVSQQRLLCIEDQPTRTRHLFSDILHPTQAFGALAISTPKSLVLAWLFLALRCYTSLGNSAHIRRASVQEEHERRSFAPPSVLHWSLSRRSAETQRRRGMQT